MIPTSTTEAFWATDASVFSFGIDNQNFKVIEKSITRTRKIAESVSLLLTATETNVSSLIAQMSVNSTFTTQIKEIWKSNNDSKQKYTFLVIEILSNSCSILLKLNYDKNHNCSMKRTDKVEIKPFFKPFSNLNIKFNYALDTFW